MMKQIKIKTTTNVNLKVKTKLRNSQLYLTEKHKFKSITLLINILHARSQKKIMYINILNNIN